MAISWSTVLDSADQNLAALLARRKLENDGLMDITQQAEAMRARGVQEGLSREELTAKNQYYADQAKADMMKAQAAAAEQQSQQELAAARQRTIDAYLAEQDPARKKALAEELTVRWGIKGLGDAETPADVPIIRINPRTGKVETLGTAPKGAHYVNEPAPPAEKGAATPYFFPIQTTEGWAAFDGRTGRIGGPAAGFRPPAGMADKIATGEALQNQLNDLRGMFNPDWVGPAAGRYQTVKLATVGERGDKGVAAMSAQINSIKNQFLQLRSGAAVTDQEMERILRELPNIEDPPDVFMAKLDQTYKNQAYLLERRQALATGRGGVGNTAAPINEPGSLRTKASSGKASDPQSGKKRLKYDPATGSFK
jgi:hypothetical protein